MGSPDRPALGKSTLIQVLLGKLKPDSGIVTLGTGVEVAYFDQLRAQLDENLSVRENVGQGSDNVTINGQSKHVMGYLQDFLFSPERARTPVKALSGGERNRLLLAKLFTQPSNLLVLDEPTNDLDIETLELLEELVTQYSGTILLVSHDRQFLNNIVTSTIVFEGDGKLREYVGGFDDWLRQKQSPMTATSNRDSSQADTVKPIKDKPSKAKQKVKLGFKQQRELESLPQLIEKIENELEQLQAQLADPKLYQDSPEKVADLKKQMEQQECELEQSFARWEELEALKNSPQ